MMIRDIQGASEMTSEKLAEKDEMYSTNKREVKETSYPKNHRRTSTKPKKSEYKPLDCVAKQRCCSRAHKLRSFVRDPAVKM